MFELFEINTEIVNNPYELFIDIMNLIVRRYLLI